MSKKTTSPRVPKNPPSRMMFSSTFASEEGNSEEDALHYPKAGIAQEPGTHALA